MISKYPAKKNDSPKRTAIVNAAIDCFLKNGYFCTSMDDIAKSAGVSKQTIYSHFGDKDQLFHQMIKLKCEELTSSALPTGEALDAKSFLIVLGENIYKNISQREAVKLYRIVIAESNNKPEIASMFYEAGPRRMLKTIEQVLSYLMKNGTLKIKNIGLAAEQFLALLEGNFHKRILFDTKKSPSEKSISLHIDQSVTFFLTAYCQ